MSKKKNKFDLTHMVHDGHVKDGETLFFVSDPSKTCTVKKGIGSEYKVVANGQVTTIHAFAQACLGQEPPNHAAQWIRNAAGKSLYELWHMNDMADAA